MKFEDLFVTCFGISDAAISKSLERTAAKFPNAQANGSSQIWCGEASVWLHKLNETDCWFEDGDIAKLALVLGDQPKFFLQIQYNSDGNAAEIAHEVHRALNDLCPGAFQFYDGRIGSFADP